MKSQYIMQFIAFQNYYKEDMSKINLMFFMMNVNIQGVYNELI